MKVFYNFQKPYNLHAVLVHEGQAASGHYWAYIHDPSKDQWLKFNDITVSDASWEELEKESVGGYHNASAYCLMYVDKTRVHLENGKFRGRKLEDKQCAGTGTIGIKIQSQNEKNNNSSPLVD